MLAACHHDDAGLRSEPLATEQEVLLHVDHWCRVTGSRGEAGGISLKQDLTRHHTPPTPPATASQKPIGH